ncbi:hypothetical protein OF83DRAFT_744805 [Amylostereum chailletii]|nr:hypothetical protein OF83DRAFT_744805 [Amylostereum chailletii]
MFGGQAGDTARNDLYVFSLPDLGTALLHTRGAVPGPRVGHAVARINSVFIVWGGDTRLESRGKQDDGLYMLNLQTRTWSKPHMDGLKPVGRFGHTMATVGPRLFVFGGQVDNDYFNDLWMFDFDTLRTKPVWTRVEVARGSAKPARRRGHTCVVFEEKIIIFGGTDGQHYFNDTWAFDGHSSQWVKLKCTGFIPAPREGHSAVVVDGVMYIFGGRGFEDMEFNDLAVFKISSRHWSMYHLGISPNRRWGHAMSKFGTNILIFGGASQDDQGEDHDVVHVLNTKSFKHS